MLKKYSTSPAIAFPQYQFFTPDRYQLKTKICLALNKKKFPEIKLNGGGDLVLPTLDNKLIEVSDVPNSRIPIYQYDSTFRTKKIIAEDRARFARAWYRQFGNYGNRGGETPELAFEAWFSMIKRRYAKLLLEFKMKNHPKYICDDLNNLKQEEFGYSAFGLSEIAKRPIINYLKGYKDKYLS